MAQKFRLMAPALALSFSGAKHFDLTLCPEKGKKKRPKMRERIKTSKLQSGKFLMEVTAKKQTCVENGVTGAVP